MASRRENLLRIITDATTTGLDLSKDRGSIREDMLWDAENVWRSYRGVINKRPAFKQYSTQIVEPTDVLTASGEVVSVVADDKRDWTIESYGAPGVYAAFSKNELIVSGWYQDSTSVTAIRRMKKSTEEFSTLDDITFSFVFRGTNMFNDQGYLQGGFSTKGGNTMRKFGIMPDGIVLRDSGGTWTAPISGTTNICDGKAHRVDFVIEGITCKLYIDSSLINTFEWSYTVASEDAFIWFQALADDGLPDDPFMASVSSIILRDSADGIYAPRISDITSQRKTVGTVKKNRVLVAGEKYIWIEYDNSGIWQPLVRKNKDTTRFVPFRDYLVMLHYSDLSNFSEVVLMNKDDSFETISDAPQCRFGAEFAGRLWLSGDPSNPKRVYYSGDRNPRLWIVPETGVDYSLEDMLNAGYFDLPSNSNESISLLNGKFFGMLVAASESTVHGITGSSPSDFSRRVVSSDIGAVGSSCGTGAMNDFLLLNNNGITSVMTTDKFGDIITERKTHPISLIFDPHNISGRTVNPRTLRKAALEYFAPMSILALSVPSTTADSPDTIYLCQLPEMAWYGPYDVSASCVRTVVLATPEAEYLCVGTPDGRVLYMSPQSPDYSNFKLSSGYLDGRSIDPSLRTQTKSWKYIRVFVNPTGNWPITIRWKTDSGKWKEYTSGVLCDKHHALVGTAKTGDAMTADRSERLMIEAPLDVRGTSLKWEITGNAPKLSLLSVEVDFHVSGIEKEN